MTKMRHLVKKDSVLYINIDKTSPKKEDILKKDVIFHSLVENEKRFNGNQSSDKLRVNSTTVSRNININSLQFNTNGNPNSDSFNSSISQMSVESNVELLVQEIQLNEEMSQLIDCQQLDEVMQDLNDIDIDLTLSTNCFPQIESQTNERIEEIVNDLKLSPNESNGFDNESIPLLILMPNTTNACLISPIHTFPVNSLENSQNVSQTQSHSLISCDSNSFKAKNMHKSNDKTKPVQRRQSYRQLLRNMSSEEAQYLSKFVSFEETGLKSDITVTKMKSESYEKKRIRLLRTVNQINFHLSKGATNVYIGYLMKKKGSPLSGLIKMEGDSQRRLGDYGAFTAGFVHTLTVIAGVVRITIETIQRTIEADDHIRVPIRSHYHLRNFKSEDAYIYFEVGFQ